MTPQRLFSFAEIAWHSCTLFTRLIREWSAVPGFTIADGRIVEITGLAVPDRLARLDLSVARCLAR